jgi:hypothetical protein
MAARSFLFKYKPIARWTLPLVMRRMERRIDDAKAAIHDICALWADIDQGFVDDAEQKLREMDEWHAAMKESVRERVEAGEHVGP